MAKYVLKRKTYGIGGALGWVTGMNNFTKAANLAATGAKGVGSQLAIGGAKLAGLGATAYAGKQVFDKMTGEG